MEVLGKRGNARWTGCIASIVLACLLVILPAAQGASAPPDHPDVIRLQSQLDSCLAYLRSLEDDSELQRLNRNLELAEAAVENAERLREDAMGVEALVEARKDYEWAVQHRNKAAEALNNLQMRRATVRHEIPGVKAQCESLRGRLDAARATGRSVVPSAAARDAWGLQEGRTWSGPAEEPARDDVEAGDTGQRRVIVDERSRNHPGRDDPDRSGPRDDPGRDPWRFDPPRNRMPLDIGAGPYHEFAALCRIGWASALARYSVGRSDDSIIDHLRFAGEHMAAANRTTFDPIRAWPDWQSRRQLLHDQASRLDRSDGASRSQLANELGMNWMGHANELAKQVVASRLARLPTCDSHYARLGYQLCYGQQAMQIAEVAEREGDRQLSRRSAGDAREHLQGARRELRELPRVKLATGSCVDLSPVDSLLAMISPSGPLPASVAAANRGFEETLRLLAGAGQTAGGCSGELAGTWIASWNGGGYIVRYEKQGDQYLGRYIMVRSDMAYRRGEVYERLRKVGERDYAGTWDIAHQKRSEQVRIRVSGDYLRMESADGYKVTQSRVPDHLVSQIRLVGTPGGVQNFQLRGYSDHDITFKPPECAQGTPQPVKAPRATGVVVSAETSPDPRRVGQRYTFSLVLDNGSPDVIHVSSVGVETTVNGRRAAGSGTHYFSPQSHGRSGWLTSVAPPGRKTVIYRGVGTADAATVGLWESTLTFHTDRGDFTVVTSSRVIR